MTLHHLGLKPDQRVKLAEEEECEEGQRSDRTRPELRTQAQRSLEDILFSLSVSVICRTIGVHVWLFAWRRSDALQTFQP